MCDGRLSKPLLKAALNAGFNLILAMQQGRESISLLLHRKATPPKIRPCFVQRHRPPSEGFPGRVEIGTHLSLSLLKET
jgi:hypothetical protein